MTNPFSTDVLVPEMQGFRVIKGDLPGHPFRGNQYRDAATRDYSQMYVPKGGFTTLEQVAQASRQIMHASDKLDPRIAAGAATAHRAMAETIRPQMKALIARSDKAKDEGDMATARMLNTAMVEAVNATSRNESAASLYDNMVNSPKSWYSGAPETQKAMQLERVTAQAADATRTFVAEMARLKALGMA